MKVLAREGLGARYKLPQQVLEMLKQRCYFLNRQDVVHLFKTETFGMVWLHGFKTVRGYSRSCIE